MTDAIAASASSSLALPAFVSSLAASKDGGITATLPSRTATRIGFPLAWMTTNSVPRTPHDATLVMTSKRSLLVSLLTLHDIEPTARPMSTAFLAAASETVFS